MDKIFVEHCQIEAADIADNYVSDYAPFTLDPGGQLARVRVTARVQLASILEIDEVGQKFRTQFNLDLSWLDFRLRFFNMKTNRNMNTLTKEEKGSIWVPIVLFRKVAG